jgi:hypothetical protein
MRNRMSTKFTQSRAAVARTLFVPSADGFPLDQPNDFLANGPQLGANRKSMAEDVREMRVRLRSQVIPWSAV